LSDFFCCGSRSTPGCRESSGGQKKMRSVQKYCAPGLLLRFAQVGFSGSAGGFVGLGPTWQKPQDIPTR
jgi:hypothetical protein